MSKIDKETVQVFKTGHTAVGTTATQLITKTLPEGVKKGVMVKAPGPDDTTPNTASVYIGVNSAVTADFNVDTGGFPLAPGEAVVIPLEDATTAYVISTAADQNAAWIII